MAQEGCVTLGLACVVMVGWIRGYFVRDVIDWNNGDASIRAGYVSSSHGIWMSRTRMPRAKTGRKPPTFRWQQQSDHSIFSNDSHTSSRPIEWHVFNEKTYRNTQVFIQYPTIVLPLTVLSAVLLLWPQ